MADRRQTRDVLVVGGGPAGIAAGRGGGARRQARHPAGKLPWLGGQIWRGREAERSRLARHWLGRLRESTVEVLLGTTAVGAPAPGRLLAENAAGAIELEAQPRFWRSGRGSCFCHSPAGPSPGCSVPEGCRALVKERWPLAGKRIVVAGSGPLLIAAAAGFRAAGARVRVIAEQASWNRLIRFGARLPLLAPDKLLQAAAYQASLLGTPFRPGSWVLEARGDASLREVVLQTPGGRRTLECDYLACAFGLVPNLELPRLLGSRIERGATWVDERQLTSVPGVYCAGEPTGIGGRDRALVEGQIAGAFVAGDEAQARSLFGLRARTRRFSEAMAQGFQLRAEVRQLAAPSTLVCRCEDVPMEALKPFDGWRAAKLHTRCGMGACQGRTCGAALETMYGWENDSVRPPVFPVSLSTLAEAVPAPGHSRAGAVHPQTPIAMMNLTLKPKEIKESVAKLKFRTQPFIGGKFTPASGGKSYSSINPANGKPIAEIASGETADIDRAVAVARKAFDAGVWSRLKPSDRKTVMLRFVELLEANAMEIALLDSLDAGKPIFDCVNIDIPDTIHCIHWHAELIDKLYERIAPSGPDNVALIVREPIGVVGMILPWNFPAQMMAWKIGPALAAGNSIVLKPAKQTSLSALRIAELAVEAGIPAGVLNVVPGPGSVLGAALCRHMDVDMVAFTGSTSVGRDLLRYSAESNLKRIILELGGKNPQVVLADADVEQVAPHAVNAAFWNMGENCSAGSRLIVHRSIKDQLVERILAECQAWPVGDPLNPKTRVGPLIEPAHMETVLGYIEAGKAEGAQLVLGGKRVLPKTGGNFVELTIFDEVTQRMKIAREEIFGPVLAVIPVDSDEEAVAVANDTNYGLAASLHTRDISKAHRFARAIRAGVVSVNSFSEGDLTTPFGGFKESGFFGRDKSTYAHEQYSELKTVWMQLS